MQVSFAQKAADLQSFSHFKAWAAAVS